MATLGLSTAANAYCVQNNSGQTIKVNRTNCSSPLGCEYRVTTSKCELNGASKGSYSHLWIFSKNDELLCSVNIKNNGDVVKVNGFNNSGKHKCDVTS